jgi:2-methylcitrate dehydratase PrpD
MIYSLLRLRSEQRAPAVAPDNFLALDPGVQGAPSGAQDMVADAIASWVSRLSWDALPLASRHATVNELLDFAGDAIAGRAAMGMPAWLDVLLECGGAGAASVVGGSRSTPWMAALANGYFGHVLELDDTHDLAVLHAGASAIPAALAAAQFRGATDGASLLTAIAAGIEVNCRLGVATDLSLVEGGWIYSALLGQFGAAVAAARALHLDAAAVRNALGIVYCFASGNHQSSREGAPTKHLQPGIAAGNGVKAALMAARGLTGVSAPFLGEDGLARTYLHGRFDQQRALRDLGREFEIDRLSMKPYPSCRLTHPAVSAALALRRELGSNLDRVERVLVRMGSQAHDVVGRAVPFRLRPQRWLDAQFSVFWTVGVALSRGALTPQQLLHEVPPSAEVQSWIDRIEAQPMPGRAVRDVGACEISATGPFGTLRFDAAQAKGHPDHPLTAEELLAKFGANVELAGWSSAEARSTAEQLLMLDRSTDIASLVNVFARSQPLNPL